MRARELLSAAAALATGCLLVAALEGGLLLAGVEPLSREDLFVGFEGSTPLFEGRSEGGGTVHTLAPGKERYFNPQSFIVPKPEGTFRIVSFGGSTTYGRPYLDDTSFPSWTARLLGKLDPARRYESINAGGISYASYRVRRLVEELSACQPDLYLLYSGHNEFLERRTFAELIEEPRLFRRVRTILHRSRTYTVLYRSLDAAGLVSRRQGETVLGDEVEAVLEEVGGPELYHRDPDFRRGVIEQYSRNIEAIADYCRRRNIPLVLCTLPSNLSGVSPFKSEHRAGLTPAELRTWEKAAAEGTAAIERGDPALALEALSRAKRIDDRYAALHFARGQALERLGRSEEAYAAFTRALEEDIIPLRAPGAFNETVREVARRRGIPLADVERVFREASPGGIPGPGLFVDHVHPSLEGQQLVALAVVDAAVGAGLVPVTPSAWKSWRPAAQAYLSASLGEVSARYRAMGLWGVGRVFYWAGKYPEAYRALIEAWKEVRDVPDLARKLGRLEMRRGKPEEAEVFLRHAESLEPGDPGTLLDLANTFLARGRAGEAAAVLDGLELAIGNEPSYHLARAEAFRQQGRKADSAAELDAALGTAAEAPDVRRGVAEGFMRLGDAGRAAKEYGEFLRLAGEPDPEGALDAWLARRRKDRERRGDGPEP